MEHAVRTESEAKATFAKVENGQVDGILVPFIVTMNIPGIAEKAAAQKRIPAMFPDRFWVDRGGLASYAPNQYSMGRQAARMVERSCEE